MGRDSVPLEAPLGTKERREREKAATRQLILEAARELFVTEGFENVTMRKIAERIEYSPTAIYVHFADKDALMTELSVCDFRAFLDAVSTVPRTADPTAWLLEMGTAYVEFALTHSNQYRLLFMTRRPPGTHAMGVQPGEDAYAVLVDAVNAAIEAGVFQSGWAGDPHHAAQLMWGGLHGLVALHIVLPAEGKIPMRDVRQLAISMMAVLMRGFTKAPPMPIHPSSAR
jgi:AcrR family transcriptional regulator